MNFPKIKIRTFKILVLFHLIFLFNQIAKSQNIEKYIPIKSEGKIPVFFTENISSRITNDKADLKTNKKSEKLVNQFNVSTAYQTDILFHSGRIVYGDTITNYLNKILNLIVTKNPTIEKKLQIYSYKSSSVNAFTLPSGVIGFNIGLFAKLKTEAEIAMVICHEIVHYQKKHALNELVETYEILGESGKKSRKNFDENIDKLYIKSKEKEIEADSLGLLLFLNTEYNTADARNIFKTLYFDEYPVEEIAFNKNFFSANDFKLPNSFFLNELAKIGEIKEENDRYATHPDIKKRLIAFDRQVEKKNNKGTKSFVLPINEFKNSQKIASLELVRLLLLNRDYGSCIYHAYCLLEKYPNMEYLWVSVAKSLYGLSKYKTEDEYHRAAKQYAKFAGESQQVHYTLKQFDRKQLNVFALKYILMIQKKYPANKHLETLIKDLFYDLVVINQLTQENFNTLYKEETNERLFYKNAFVSELSDSSFVKYFVKYEKSLQRKKDYENLTAKELKLLEKNKKDSVKKFGHKIYADSVIVIQPKVIYTKKDDVFDYVKADSLEKLIEYELITTIKSEKIKHSYLNKELTISSVDAFNESSTIKEWFQEIYSHGEIDILTSISDEMKDIANKRGLKYLLFTSCYYSEINKKSVYEIVLINIEKETVVYENIKKNKTIPNIKDANKFLKESIKTIKT